MAAKRDATNSGILDRLDALRLETKGDITAAVAAVTNSTTASINALAVSQGRLEKKFDDLEAGRLTRAEANISDLRLELQRTKDSSNSAERVLTGKFLALGAVGMIILASVMSLAVTLIARKIK